jgi:hypothetical protein
MSDSTISSKMTLSQAASPSSEEGRSWNDWPVEMDPHSLVILGRL